MTEWISVREAAKLAGCIRQNINYHIGRKNIHARRSGGLWLVDRESVVSHFKLESTRSKEGIDSRISGSFSGIDLEEGKRWLERSWQRIADEASERQKENFKAKRRLEFENRLGVDLYNLDIQVQEHLPRDVFRKRLSSLGHLISQYSHGPDVAESLNMPISANMPVSAGEEWVARAEEEINAVIDQEFCELIDRLPEEQTGYKRLVDKAIEGEMPSDSDIDYMWERYRDSTQIVRVEGDSGEVLREVPSLGIDTILGHAHRFLFRLWNRKVKAGKCISQDCDRLFIHSPRGRNQKYCSRTCKMREYRRRKEQVAPGL